MTLKILLLDDNPDDRALSRRELSRHFEACIIREVGDRDGLEKEMQDGLAVDLVITDYQMRWTTGLDVLKRVKAHDPQMPVIMFTATGTQEIAVDAMKLGLDDYVIKSPRHYARLPVAVRGCLDRSEIRARAIRSETRLAALLENINLGVFRMSLEGKLQDANKSFWKMLDVQGQDHDAASFVHPLLDKVRQQLPELKIVLDTSELQFESGDPATGERFYIVKLVRVKVNGHDAIDGIMEDATSLRQANLKIQQLNEELEQKIIERTKQLEEANDALETFGFSVSHDLREPLRTIQGYAVALRQDVAEGNIKEFQFYVDRIEAITRRIDQMVNDLLEFARLSRADIPVENIAVLDAIKEAQSTLMPEQAYRSADIRLEVPEGLVAKAHRLVLAQAITNLISNAVKFVQPGHRAEALVSAQSNGARIRIEVKDGGIGIDPQAQDRIFNVFERLHGEEEYPGTGIGLAIVKKGIERMGGSVGVESAPGTGSTFWIELPSA